MGGWETLVDSACRAAVATAPASALCRALLWRAGAAAWARPQSSLLNDVNPHLINFYRQVQRGLRVTIETKYEKELFYAHRDRFNRLIKEDESETTTAALLFYYLNRTCYNGLCRFNRGG